MTHLPSSSAGGGTSATPSSVTSPRRRGGGLVPFRAVCDCPSGRRRPPVRLNRQFAVALVDRMPRHQQIGTYRCSDCGGTVILTVGQVDLNAPATSGP